MSSALSLEPVDTVDTSALLKIDFHVPDDCPIRGRLYSADEVRIEVGAVSLSLSAAALARLLEVGAMARDDLELIAKYPDPLPEI